MKFELRCNSFCFFVKATRDDARLSAKALPMLRCEAGQRNTGGRLNINTNVCWEPREFVALSAYKTLQLLQELWVVRTVTYPKVWLFSEYWIPVNFLHENELLPKISSKNTLTMSEIEHELFVKNLSFLKARVFHSRESIGQSLDWTHISYGDFTANFVH